MTELEIVFEQLNDACCPEEVFGKDPGMIPHLYRDFTKVVHPDRNPKHKTLSEKAFQALNDLKDAADESVKAGTWGKRIKLPKCQSIQIGAYKVKPRPIVGDIADIYTIEGNAGILKVARHHDDNDLLRAEAAALVALRSKIPGPVKEGVPDFAGLFSIDGTWKRNVNVLSLSHGFVPAQYVHAKLPVVDPRTVVWIFKRVLVLLEYVHHAGLVHGAILPPHVLLYPDNDGAAASDSRKHSIRLIDWCYSVSYQSRTRLSAWVPAWESHYPPELKDKSSIGPASDLYMSAMLIRYLAGGLPGPLEAILARCLEPDPAKRPQDAGKVFDEWRKAAAEVYGSPKWIEFNLPK